MHTTVANSWWKRGPAVAAALLVTLVWTQVAQSESPAAAISVRPSTWWVIGPFPCYDEAMFQAAEPIDNARNDADRGNEWNRVIALGGREVRPRQMTVPQPGTVDFFSLLEGTAPNACAYAGVRLRAEKAGEATAVLTSTGPVRWLLNNRLIAQDMQGVEQKVTVSLKAGWNCLLAKSWNPAGKGAWSIGCEIVGAEGLQQESAVAPTAIHPGAGRRNVAIWSEGSRVAVSSIAWRQFPMDHRGLSMLNDGFKPGSPGGAGAAWNSHNVAGLPQWAWVRFPGMRRVDRVVLYAASPDRRPLDLVGETTDDGGISFKPLFKVNDATWEPRSMSLGVDFPAVVTDNVRVRIDRAAMPESSGFVTAQLAEIEVLGDDAPGVGSLALVAGPADAMRPSNLAPDAVFKPDIRPSESQIEVATPWYRVVLDRSRPRLVQWSVDALGQGKFDIRLLRTAGAMAMLSPMFDAPAFPLDAALSLDGNVARYPAVAVAPGVSLQVVFRFEEKGFDLELTTASPRAMPLYGGVFRFDMDFWQTPTSFFGRSGDPLGVVTLPCYIHAPDCGTFHVAQQGDGVVFRPVASADDFNLSARQLFDIAPWSNEAGKGCGQLPAGSWQSTLRFDVEPVMPWLQLVAEEPRLRGLPRYALNIAQWMPGNKLLSNNVVSTPCPLSLQFYAEMAVYAPQLQHGVSLMDLVAATVDRYLDGAGGHLYWHGMRVEVTPPGKWTASLESPGFLINSAWYAVHTVGGRTLLERWLPRLEAVAGHLEAHDTDGDGIVDSVDHGHWFDTYNLPPGVKEAHSTAVNYDAFRHLAELEELAGRPEKVEHYRERAKLIKDSYIKVFFNPETGVIGGWRDTQGKLHDPMFPWVNGYAICAGLVTDEQANEILDRLLAQMKKIGFTQYQYGLPTNLLPMQADQWSHGAHGWQDYMNGSITPPYSNYVIMALYKLGRYREAEQLLWPQVASFDKGTFNSGVRIPHMPPRNPVGSAFYRWDGSAAEGEGYLPENWHAYAGIFAGHYGIRFDEHGYALEKWSPLKGRRIRCGLPVMGHIQETVE